MHSYGPAEPTDRTVSSVPCARAAAVESNSLGHMGITRFLLAAAAFALLATSSQAADGTRTVRKSRPATPAARPTAVGKKLHEAKRSSRLTVIPTDIRFRRYLANGDDLGAVHGNVQQRSLMVGDAISDGP
jgi:hypothetical protein